MNEDSVVFDMNEDEQTHLGSLPVNVLTLLELGSSGALLASGVSMLDEDKAGWRLEDEPEFVIPLLILKCSRMIRFAIVGISFGYYGGASLPLRSAYEALAYAQLFSQRPEEIAGWIKDEYHPGLKPRERNAAQRKRLRRAEAALRRKEKTQMHHMYKELWNQTSENIHTSLESLAVDFGLSGSDILPDDLDDVYHEVGEDLVKALDLFWIRRSMGQRSAQSKVHKSHQTLPLADDVTHGEDEMGVREWTIGYTSLLAHRLTDFAIDASDPSPKQTQEYEKWHAEFISQFEEVYSS